MSRQLKFLSFTPPSKLTEHPKWLTLSSNEFIPGGYIYQINTTDKEYKETIEGKFDPPVEVDDLLFSFGFDNLQFLDLEDIPLTLELNLS